MSLVGRQIGRYRILEQVGQGGMSVVYKGLDTTLEREVAVKVLHPHLANKLESRKRLEREAKAVARLHHPNILEVFDYAGADAQEAYIVTEYIRGRTLRQFITDESLQPPEIAMMVVHELASALAHAHDAGVIHRDLKPENVMVREDGVLKLMDFGIAKILDKDEKMTMTGALVGSPAHMAPEIIEGEEAGAEADVFSLGTMLYLFSTGKLPFTAPNTTATLKKILDCVYDDPRQLVPTVSDELAEIISLCLQRRPGDRFSSAGKLRDALANSLAELGLTRAHEELPRFFIDPRSYRKEIIPRVTTALLAVAERQIAEKKSARALSALNQVLAHDPSNERAQGLLGQMKARRLREQRNKKLIRLSAAAGVLFIVAISSWKGFELARRPPEFRLPAFVGPTDIVLASVAWPPGPTPELALVEDAGVVDGGLALAPDAGVGIAKIRPNGVGLPKNPTTAQTVRIKVTIRPFGYLAVDNGPRSAEATLVHEIEVTRGKHTFTVTCDKFCEPNGVTSEIPIDGSDVNIAAPLKSSLVSFDGYPPDAIVRVGATERTVAQSKITPFVITTPPLVGRMTMRHEVTYEVFQGTTSIERGEKKVEPGQSLIITMEPKK